MKLKPITYELEKFPYKRRSEQKLVNYPPTKVNFAPRWNRENVAYNFINREFRAKRHMPLPLDKKHYNKSFTGNGARGKMRHDKEDLSKVTGYQKLVREKKKNNININEVALQEKRQINFDGAELKGKRTTIKSEGLAYIREYGGKKKYNRGGQAGGRRSGAYSGGLMMRQYEREQIKQSSADKMVVEDDEFSNVQALIQKQQIPDSNIKTDSLGI
jgi:hypothetical protein